MNAIKHKIDHLSSFKKWGGPDKSRFVVVAEADCLLGAGVLGDSLGSLGHGVLGQFTGEEETDSSLNLPGGDGGAPVVVGET